MATNQFHTVLLVENEALIALDLEGMLLSAGAKSIHHTMSSQDALDWLKREKADLAIPVASRDLIRAYECLHR